MAYYTSTRADTEGVAQEPTANERMAVIWRNSLMSKSPAYVSGNRITHEGVQFLLDLMKSHDILIAIKRTMPGLTIAVEHTFGYFRSVDDRVVFTPGKAKSPKNDKPGDIVAHHNIQSECAFDSPVDIDDPEVCERLVKWMIYMTALATVVSGLTRFDFLIHKKAI